MTIITSNPPVCQLTDSQLREKLRALSFDAPVTDTTREFLRGFLNNKLAIPSSGSYSIPQVAPPPENIQPLPQKDGGYATRSRTGLIETAQQQQQKPGSGEGPEEDFNRKPADAKAWLSILLIVLILLCFKFFY